MDREDWLMLSPIALIVLLLGALFYGMYQESKKPTFTLVKDRWTCTASHEESNVTYIHGANGTMTPIYSTDTVCDQYTKKN